MCVCSVYIILYTSTHSKKGWSWYLHRRVSVRRQKLVAHMFWWPPRKVVQSSKSGNKAEHAAVVSLCNQFPVTVNQKSTLVAPPTSCWCCNIVAITVN